jgi:hypothetical protein
MITSSYPILDISWLTRAIELASQQTPDRITAKNQVFDISTIIKQISDMENMPWVTYSG